MERILFGDNQFFGVSHLSDEKARAQAIQFRDNAAIMKVLDSVREHGINTFMCTTHDRIAGICDHMRNHADVWSAFNIYPCMPYAHKYANAVTELGILGTIKQYVPGNIFSSFAQGGLALVSSDFRKLITLLIDAEMKMFRGIRTPVIFLQNVVVDMILGLNMPDVLAVFDQHIRAQYDAEPGYITMNMPALLGQLESAGIRNPIICTSINKIGFRMPGGVGVYEDVLRKRRCRAIAMQVLAAGAISPSEALRYVCGLEGVESILFGASTAGHIVHTKELIERYWNLTP